MKHIFYILFSIFALFNVLETTLMIEQMAEFLGSHTDEQILEYFVFNFTRMSSWQECDPLGFTTWLRKKPQVFMDFLQKCKQGRWQCFWQKTASKYQVYDSESKRYKTYEQCSVLRFIPDDFLEIFINSQLEGLENVKCNLYDDQDHIKPLVEYMNILLNDRPELFLNWLKCFPDKMRRNLANVSHYARIGFADRLKKLIFTHTREFIRFALSDINWTRDFLFDLLSINKDDRCWHTRFWQIMPCHDLNYDSAQLTGMNIKLLCTFFDVLEISRQCPELSGDELWTRVYNQRKSKVLKCAQKQKIKNENWQSNMPWNLF